MTELESDSWFLFLSCCLMSVAETVTLTLGRTACCVFSSPGPFCEVHFFSLHGLISEGICGTRQRSSSHREQTSHVSGGEQELFLQDLQTS